MPEQRRRVLFVAEAVTLAHVARPAQLINGLAGGDEFELHLAHQPRYRHLLGALPAREHDIQSITPQQFNNALARGKPLYDTATLEDYVRDDLSLLRSVQPDIVVGDFRLSLSVSCRLHGVPYVAINNAYWSPHVPMYFTVPELPLTRWLGPMVAQRLFDLARPLAFALHSRPLNRVRRRHGLAALGSDLRRVYTDADYVLYADIAELYGSVTLPERHQFMGPVLWEPASVDGGWLAELPTDKPVIYVTMGSSGDSELLPLIVNALSDHAVTALLSTAGAALPERLPPHIIPRQYLPGNAVTALASLVVCNGGSPTTQQALAAGVPVIGVAGNLDQYLNMAALERAGAGLCVRSGQMTARGLSATIHDMLQRDSFRLAAGRIRDLMARYDAVSRLRGLLLQIDTQPPSHRAT